MKKFLSVILTLLLMCAVFVSAPSALATNITDDLEDIVGVYELRSFPTFAETGLPYDEITTYFPETWDVKYENGNLIIKDFPCESVEIFDHLDYAFT